MAQPALNSPAEAVPGTPGIREIRSDSTGSDHGLLHFAASSGQCLGPGESPSPIRPGIRKVNMRAEIDTSPPFGSVMEAVTRFGGHGPWVPSMYKFGDNYGRHENEEFDIKKVEEQAAELEKDLIVKELETLDVLEELTTTKRIVEELKRQLQTEALKCMAVPQDHHPSPEEHISIQTPHIKEMNVANQNQTVGNSTSSPCPISSPDMILMELKRAKMNLGKTINDLGVIQTSVDTLTKKMKKEKELIEKTRERLTSSTKFAGVLPLEDPDHHEQDNSNIIRVKPAEMVGCGENHIAENGRFFEHSKSDSREDQSFLRMDPVASSRSAMPAATTCMKTAEMRWFAAKKMGEAAKAAEAVALAEIKALTSGESPSEFLLSEPDKMSFNFRVQSPLNYRGQEASNWSRKKLADAMLHADVEAHSSKTSVMRKLKEATEEFKFSKVALEEALNRVEIANRKQIAVEEALNRWIPEQHDRKRIPSAYNSPRINIFHPADHQHHHKESPMSDGHSQVLVDNINHGGSKPVLKTTVSMRDVLSKKQVGSSHEEYGRRRDQSGHSDTHKVALSEMLQALREDLTFPSSKAEKDGTHDHHQKQYLAQRKKFGFIQISLPLTKPSKKKMQSNLNPM